MDARVKPEYDERMGVSANIQRPERLPSMTL